MRIKEKLNTFKKDTSGQFAVWTALLAVPMLVSVSFAFEHHALENRRASLKGALDAAALAAVSDQTISVDARAQKAETHFWSNIPIKDGVTVDVLKSDETRVIVEASVEKPALMAGIIGQEKFRISDLSEAIVTKGSTICVLALDPNSEKSLEISRGASLNASTCGVQVNSTHKLASIVEQGGKAAAKDFCISGGAYGQYAPFANTECSPIADPYANLQIPAPDACIDKSQLGIGKGSGQLVLKPGTYCDGMDFSAKDTLLEPGIYHILDGPVIFEKGSTTSGDGVVFVMHGQSYVQMRMGANVDLKAPPEGPLAGLIFAQELDLKPKTSPSYPSSTSSITNGGKVRLVGTVYLPTHKFVFAQGGKADTQAPATSFIAYQVQISQGAKVAVAVDYNAFDLPPIQPRSDESVRLIR